MVRHHVEVGKCSEGSVETDEGGSDHANCLTVYYFTMFSYLHLHPDSQRLSPSNFPLWHSPASGRIRTQPSEPPINYNSDRGYCLWQAGHLPTTTAVTNQIFRTFENQTIESSSRFIIICLRILLEADSGETQAGPRMRSESAEIIEPYVNVLVLKVSVS